MCPTQTNDRKLMGTLYKMVKLCIFSLSSSADIWPSLPCGRARFPQRSEGKITLDVLLFQGFLGSDGTQGRTFIFISEDSQPLPPLSSEGYFLQGSVRPSLLQHVLQDDQHFCSLHITLSVLNIEQKINNRPAHFYTSFLYNQLFLRS